MTETPKVGLKLKIFARTLIVNPFLSQSIPPGVQEKRKKLGGRSAPPLPVLKGPKYTGSNRVIIIPFSSRTSHFRFLTFLARDLRGLAKFKVYFSFVIVSDFLGPSLEHNRLELSLCPSMLLIAVTFRR